jgi:hypothetical protein
MIETAADRLEFFDTENGFAELCEIRGPAPFVTLTIPVIRNAISAQTVIYEANIEAPAENFICRIEDLATVERRLVKQYTATLGGVTFKLERVETIEDGLLLQIYLKK